MKKIITCLFCSLAALMIISCGSTDVKDSSTEDEIKNETENLEENIKPVPEVVKIARFDDWEYKGFGKDLPLWVEAAVDLDYETLSQFYPDKDLLVVRGYGSNTDMCESASYQESPYPEEAEFIEALWVRVNSKYEKLEKPYISIRIFNKISEVEFLE